MAVGAILIVMAVGVVIAGGLVMLYALLQNAAFERRAIPVQAEITNLSTDQTTYYVGYTYFAGPDGQSKMRQAGNYRISGYAYKQLKVGGPIKIRYLPDHPESSKPAPAYLDADVERSNPRGCLALAAMAAVIFVISGVIGISMTPPDIPPTVDPVAAQNQRDLEEIHTTLDSKIPGWRRSVSSQMVRLSAADAGFSASTQMGEVDYGLCEVNGKSHFYLYVMRFTIVGSSPNSTSLAQAYLYLPDLTEDTDCFPEGWTQREDLALGGNWRFVYVTFPPQVPFYKLTATAGGN